MIWGANNYWVYLTDPNAAIKYVLKYISKGEKNSDAGEDFNREAFEQAEENGVQKAVQRILLNHLKGREYSLSEVNLILNRGSIVEFSREFEIFNALGDTPVVLDGPPTGRIHKKTRGDIFDARNDDPNFTLLVRKYDDPEATVKPCNKHPTLYTLFDYISMFSPD